MTDNNYGLNDSAYYDQWAVFQERARQLLQEALGGLEVPGVLWTSHLTDPEYLEASLNSSQYIIQIWTTRNDSAIQNLLSRGYRVIFSNYDAWYLDCGMGAWVGNGHNWCSPYKGWQVVYDNSPHDIAMESTGNPHTDLILGGEAAIWTEQADDATIDSKVRSFYGVQCKWELNGLEEVPCGMISRISIFNTPTQEIDPDKERFYQCWVLNPRPIRAE